jgi:hypothetical protein
MFFKPNSIGSFASARRQLGMLALTALFAMTSSAHAQSGQASDQSLNGWAALTLISIVLLAGLALLSNRRRMR